MIYSVRPMGQGDLAQVNEIDREAFPTQWPAPNYHQELQNKLARYLVVGDDTRTAEEIEVKQGRGLSRIGQWFQRNRIPSHRSPSPTRQYLIGFAGIWVLADEAHITNLAVRKHYQRRGIGELLLIATIDLAQGMKAGMMTLEVRASNFAAQNLYLKYGFEQVGLRRGYYVDNREDGLIMSTESITSASFQTRLQDLRKALARKMAVDP